MDEKSKVQVPETAVEFKPPTPNYANERWSVPATKKAYAVALGVWNRSNTRKSYRTVDRRLRPYLFRHYFDDPKLFHCRTDGMEITIWQKLERANLVEAYVAM